MKRREKIAEYIRIFSLLVKEAAKGRPARKNKKVKRFKAAAGK